MAYATVEQARELIPQYTIGVSSRPTITQATAIIDATSSEIDVALSGAGLSVPVVAPSYFVEWLSQLNKYGAVAAILKAMFPDAVGPDDTPAYAFWEKRYREGLKAISDGSMIPGGSTPGAGSVMPSSYLTRNPDEEQEIGTIAEPQFTMGKVF